MKLEKTNFRLKRIKKYFFSEKVLTSYDLIYGKTINAGQYTCFYKKDKFSKEEDFIFSDFWDVIITSGEMNDNCPITDFLLKSFEEKIKIKRSRQWKQKTLIFPSFVQWMNIFLKKFKGTKPMMEA